MSNHATPIELLFQKAKDYGKTNLELLQLKAIDKSVDLISTLVARLAIILFTALAILIINIGLALWIGKLLNDSFWGFFIVGGFYIIVAIALHVFKNIWIKNPISNYIISNIIK